MNREIKPEDFWKYHPNKPESGNDARYLVTLIDKHGMVWVGIRAYNYACGYWMNNNEPIDEDVLAFQPLPEPAKKRWIHGELI